MTKRYVIVPDTQLPFHNRKALSTVIRFIGEYSPDEVVHVGDLMDFPSPSRWNKGTREEFERSVPLHVDEGKRFFLDPLRAVYDGPVKIFEGNHDERTRVYLDKYAPGLSGYDYFNFEKLLDFDGFGIEKLGTYYEFAPNWVMTHGHKGQIRVNGVSGMTALNAAKKFGKSVVLGHCHRMAKVYHSTGYNGNVKTLTGVEVGHLMDTKVASKQYLKEGSPNWQMGFGLAVVDGPYVRVDPIEITNSRFVVEGQTFHVK